MKMLIQIHEMLLILFDDISGYVETVVKADLLGWWLSLAAEVVFALQTIYLINECLKEHSYLSFLIMGVCLYASAYAINRMVNDKQFMLTDAFKQAMRADPATGLSKLFVLIFVTVMSFISSNYVESLIFFVDQILYVVGFYLMISNPTPKMKRVMA